jgi:hypothetical protein
VVAVVASAAIAVAVAAAIIAIAIAVVAIGAIVGDRIATGRRRVCRPAFAARTVGAVLR